MSFLSLNTDAFGLDISDTYLKIAKLKKKGGGFCLASFGKFPLKTGVIKDGEVKDKDSLIEALKNAVAKVQGEKIKASNIVFSLPEEKAFLRIIQMPLMEEEDLQKAVKYEAENHIPLPLEDVYLDFQIIKPLYNHLDYLDVLIAALPKDIVDSYITALKEAGLKPVALETESWAIIRALIKDEASIIPILVINIEDQKTDLIIFAGYGIRFTSTIAIGKKTFIRSIEKNLELSPAEAEKMIMEYGVKPDGGGAVLSGFDKKKKDIFGALIPVSTDFLEQIKKYIDFYSTHKNNEHLLPNPGTVKKIVFCGEGANIKGFKELLFQELKIPVQLGNPWINILSQPISEIPGLPFKESLEYTTALGLALRGIKEKSQ